MIYSEVSIWIFLCLVCHGDNWCHANLDQDIIDYFDSVSLVMNMNCNEKKQTKKRQENIHWTGHTLMLSGHWKDDLFAFCFFLSDDFTLTEIFFILLVVIFSWKMYFFSFLKVIMCFSFWPNVSCHDEFSVQFVKWKCLC